MASSLTSGRPNSLAGVDTKPSDIIPAGGEFYDCVRFCAMFDRPYIARYERKAGKPFQLVGTFKDEAMAGVGNGKRSSVVLHFDEIDAKSPVERCSWCGVKDIFLCGACLHFVCRARVSKRDGGLYYRCRCKHEGMLEGRVDTCDASKQSAPSRQPNRLGFPGKGSAAALPSGQLRLKS